MFTSRILGLVISRDVLKLQQVAVRRLVRTGESSVYSWCLQDKSRHYLQPASYQVTFLPENTINLAKTMEIPSQPPGRTHKPAQ